MNVFFKIISPFDYDIRFPSVSYMYPADICFYLCPGTDPMVGNKTVQRAKFSILRVYIPTGANTRKQANVFLNATKCNENKQQWVVDSLWKFKDDAIIILLLKLFVELPMR